MEKERLDAVLFLWEEISSKRCEISLYIAII